MYEYCTSIRILQKVSKNTIPSCFLFCFYVLGQKRYYEYLFCYTKPWNFLSDKLFDGRSGINEDDAHLCRRHTWQLELQFSAVVRQSKCRKKIHISYTGDNQEFTDRL